MGLLPRPLKCFAKVFGVMREQRFVHAVFLVVGADLDCHDALAERDTGKYLAVALWV